VLTDGSLWYGPEGEELKGFHTRDGLGIKLLLQEGIEVVVISGRRSRALERRLEDLGVREAVLGCEAKGERFGALLAARGIAPEDAAFVGDDLPDLLAMRLVGLPVAVRDADARVRAEALWVTDAPGGRGAVREVADALLAARGRLDAAADAYLARVGGG
ncbi:MAG: HAD hydrolase family protein, partial [Polyangiaceae bacterium]|nr:HAD hydrolase family protein [Polyangiaceae bacterium]